MEAAASVDWAAKVDTEVAVQDLEGAASADTVVWAAMEAAATAVDLEAGMVVPEGLVD